MKKFLFLIFLLQFVSLAIAQTTDPTKVDCYVISDGMYQETLYYKYLDNVKNYVKTNCERYAKSKDFFCLVNDLNCTGSITGDWREAKNSDGTSKYYLNYTITNDPEYPQGHEAYCQVITKFKDPTCSNSQDSYPPSDPQTDPDTGDSVFDSFEVDSEMTVKSKTTGLPASVKGSPVNTCVNSQKACGNPVNISTGLMWHSETDFFVKGRTDDTNIVFKRTYLTQPVLLSNGFGNHWFHNFQSKIYSLELDDADALLWTDENGGAYFFKKNADGTFKNPPGFAGKLVEASDHYELINSRNVKFIYNKTKKIAPIGSLLSITDAHKETISLSYNDKGFLTSIDSDFVGKISFTYNPLNLISRILRERDNLSYSYFYDTKGNLIGTNDFAGKKTYFTYVNSLVGATNGLLSSITDAAGRVISFQYDQKGRVVAETEPGNAKRFYTYDEEKRETTVKEIDGSISVFSFDADYRLKKSVDAKGAISSFVWKEKNLKDSEMDSLGYVTKYEYDQNNNLILLKRPKDKVGIKAIYDLDFNRPIKIKRGNSAEVNFVLDNVTGDISNINSGNLQSSYEYDSFGNLIKVNNGLSEYSDETDENGLKTFKFDNHNPENIQYDVRGRITQRDFLSGRSLSYLYDNYDRIIEFKDSDGASYKFIYDVFGKLIQKEIYGKNNLKEITKYLWDSRDRLIQITDNLGRKTQFQYNISNNPKVVIDKPTAVIAPDGKTTVFRYDLMQRLVQKIEANGSSTKLDYNLRGDLIKLTDAENNSTTFDYDGNGRVIKKNSPTLITDAKGVSEAAREVVLYTYDDSDKILKEVRQLDTYNARKTEIIYIYDEFERLTSKTFQKIDSNGNIVESKSSSFSYESILNENLLKTADNEVAQLSFEYELLPPYKITRATSKATDPSNPLGLIETDHLMTHDVSGELSLVKSLNGSTILTSIHDAAGRLVNIKSGNLLGENTPVFEANITYDSLGRKVSMSNSDGFKQAITYDSLSRVSSLIWKRGNSVELSQKLNFDLAGNIISSIRENAETIYGYDKVNQLTSAQSQLESRNFQYDKIGNRINDSLMGKANFISNALISDQKASNSFNIYAYDRDGLGSLSTVVNEKDKTQKDLNYNLNGKLKTFQFSHAHNSDSIYVTYYYDALDRRVAKYFQIATNATIKSFTQAYNYLGGSENLLISKDGNGKFTLFVDDQGIDQHLGKVNTGEAKTFLTDSLGTVINGISNFGKYNFDSFGLPSEYQANPMLLDANSIAVMYGFAGREFDLESSFYYNRERNYDPKLGRFYKKDPLEFDSGDTNFYRYAFNNSVKYKDPYGLCPLAVPAGIALADLLFAGAGTAAVAVFADSMNDLYLAFNKSDNSKNDNFSDDDKALIELAKEKRVKGVTEEESKILVEWGKESKDPRINGNNSRGPESHPERKYKDKHIHVGPINHIPVK